MRTSVPVPKEFSFELSVEFLRRSPRELLHKVEGSSVVKLLNIGENKILFSIHSGNNKLIIDVLNAAPGTPGASLKGKLQQHVTEWFDLATDLKPFYKMASKDEFLKSLVKQYYGYRIIGQPDLFESLAWAVLGQQINLAFAYTLKHRFVEQFGERLMHGCETYYLFPEPALVAGLSDEVLLPLQFSRQKSLYVRTIAEAFANGVVSREKLTGLPFEEAKEQLMKIKGIGNWTANYALMKTFRYPNAFPLEDAGLHNAIKKLLGMPRKPTPEEVRKLFKRYRGWEAYATLYLWKSL